MTLLKYSKPVSPNAKQSGAEVELPPRCIYRSCPRFIETKAAPAIMQPIARSKTNTFAIPMRKGIAVMRASEQGFPHMERLSKSENCADKNG